MTKETDTIEEYKELEVVNIRLVKEPSIISEKPISNVNDAVNLIKNLIKDFDREAFCTMNLTADGKPISMNMVSIGTLTAAPVSPREVLKSSVLSNASAYIAFHCHPSGNPTPSMDDAVATQRLKEASEIMEIKLVDHIIIGCGSGRTFSFLAHDLMDGDIVKKYERYKNNKEWER